MLNLKLYMILMTVLLKPFRYIDRFLYSLYDVDVASGLLVCTIFVFGPFGGGSSHGTTTILGLRPSAACNSCSSPADQEKGIQCLHYFPYHTQVE